MTVTIADVRTEALRMLDGVPPGEPLSTVTAALIDVAVHASVSTLDPQGIESAARRALDAGATADEIHEALVVVSALGVHSLMEGSRRLAAVLREHGAPDLDAPLDAERTALRDRMQGDGEFWAHFDREVPGFLDALLRLSPEAYEAFFAYCAVPWRTGFLPPVVKELIAVACDATPTHRYLPGLRLHLTNAVHLDAGRQAVLQTLDIAAAAPPHQGVPAG